MFGNFGTNMAMGGQQGLPANPVQVTQPWFPVNLQSAPYVPRVSMDPQLQSLVPLISSVAAMEIQQQAQNKPNQPLRVFMHNLYSINAFQNAEFENLLAACLDFVWVHVGKGSYQNAEQAISDGVPKVVEMLAGMQPLMYPMLAQYLDPQTQAAAIQLQQVFNSIAQEIKMVKQNQGFGAAMSTGAMMTGGFVGNPQMGMQGGMQGRMVPVAAGPRFGAVGNIPMGNATPSTVSGGSGVFGNRQQTFTGDGQRAPINPSRYDEKILRQPLTSKEEPVQQQPEVIDVQARPAAAAQPAPAPEAPKEEQLLPVAQLIKAKWKPNPDYPYIPAWDPSQNELFYRVTEAGQFEPVMKKVNPVDYERHAISPTFGPRPVGWQHNQAVQKLEEIRKNIEQLNATEDTGEQVATEETPAPVLPFTSAKRANWLLDTSELTLWIVGDIERLSTRIGADQQIPDVYRMYARVAYPVVGLKDESDAVRGFGACKTFMELAEKLKADAEKVSPALWAAANDRITRAINRLLKYNLSLPTVRIDSFVEDLEDLVKVLQSRYGDFVSEAFLRHQSDHIRRVFGIPDPVESEGLTSTMIDLAEYQTIEAPKITFLSSNYSFTFLNCRSHDLQLELGPTKVAMIHQTLVPVMHELLRGLFEASDAEHQKKCEEALAAGEETPAPFARHLIRTSDGRVMEATRGDLGENFFVLSLVE